MASPIRRGTSKSLTLDDDAIELLRILAPSTRRYGSYISELLRREWERRAVRREMVAELASVGCMHVTAEPTVT
jgi:hypothetical protein